MPNSPLKFCSYANCSTLVKQGRCAQHERRREYERPNHHDRRLYDRAEWHRLRLQVQREQPFCDECAAEGKQTLGKEVDHTIPHRGNEQLFFARSNLKNKCVLHHRRKTQRGE